MNFYGACVPNINVEYSTPSSRIPFRETFVFVPPFKSFFLFPFIIGTSNYEEGARHIWIAYLHVAIDFCMSGLPPLHPE